MSRSDPIRSGPVRSGPVQSSPVNGSAWIDCPVLLTSFGCLEGQDVAGGSSVGRVDNSHANKVDGERHKLVDESFRRVADHFPGARLAFFLRPSLDLVAFEVT